VSQSSEFCRHNPLCYFSTSVYCCCLFRYRLSPETFGYTLVRGSCSTTTSRPTLGSYSASRIWPLIHISWLSYECVELYVQSLYMLQWR